jgi:MoaA/NifB/PqqE/SkfB family radical SAM enzyme
MCDCWKKPSPDELTLEELARIFRQLPRFDVVRLSGGEPFVRGDLEDIASLANRFLRPQLLHVTTNGFLTGRIVDFCEKLARRVPLRILVSLDGTEAKHNEVRGRDYAWKTAMATVRELAPRQRELGLRLSVNQTILDREGAGEHRQLRALLNPLGVPVSAVLAYDISATYSLEREVNVAPGSPGEFKTHGSLDSQAMREILAELQAGLENLTWLERLAKSYYLEGIAHRLANGRAQPNPKCVALNSHLRLFPNGDVPTCQFNSHRVGNLRHETFASLWRKDEIKAARAWVRKCPGCWAECEVLPNALYSGDILRYAGQRGLFGKSDSPSEAVSPGPGPISHPCPRPQGLTAGQ